MSFKTFFAAGFVAVVSLAGVAHANEAASFQLRNASGQSIDVIQVSPISEGQWGADLLGDRVVLSGATVTVDPGRTGCMFDVRVTYHNQDSEAFRNIDLCRTSRISFANTQTYSMN